MKEKILNLKVIGTVAAFLAAAVLLLTLGWISDYHSKAGKIEKLSAQVGELNSQVEDSKSQLESLTAERDKLKSENQEQEEQLEYLDTEISSYEEKISDYVDQSETISQQTQTIDDLNTQLQELQEKYDALEEAHSKCKKITVYWVKNGSVYHWKKNCKQLKKEKKTQSGATIQSGTIEESGKSKACTECG
jgi:colicin import membrane protein